jgi:hypothetical protein
MDILIENPTVQERQFSAEPPVESAKTDDKVQNKVAEALQVHTPRTKRAKLNKTLSSSPSSPSKAMQIFKSALNFKNFASPFQWIRGQELKRNQKVPPFDTLSKTHEEMKGNYRNVVSDLKKSSSPCILSDEPPASTDRDFASLNQGIRAANEQLQELADDGILSREEISPIPEIEVPYPSAANIPPNQADVVQNLIGKTITTLNKQISAVERMIREYLNDVEARNKSMTRLGDLKQRCTLKGELDWKNDPGLKELIEYAKSLGVQVPKGDKWSEEDKAILRENIDEVKTSLMSSNETANFKLTLCQNTYKMLWELLSDLMKVFSNIQEHFARNLPTR